MVFKDSVCTSGELAYIVRSRGEIIEEYSEKNMIMTLGRVAVARLFAGLPGGNALSVGVGEGSDPPNAEQTDLSNRYLVAASAIGFARAEVQNTITTWVPSSEPTPNVRIDFIFSEGDANGLEIKEFGLFTADETMFARRVRANGRAIAKDEDLTIEGYWIIRF